MYSPLRLAFKYIYYYLTATNGRGHGIHSPFIFDFIKKVLNDKNYYPAYDGVEQLRKQLLKDQTLLTIKDFGAGSAIDKTNQRTIASIAKNAAKPKKYGQLIYRMVKYYQPQTVLELGTSLGITTSYLATANSRAKVITMEGATEIADIARENFRILEIRNIEIKEGDFDNTLPSVIGQQPLVDFVFIDGNHRNEPTIRYFHQLLTKTNNDSILVFDDIHWNMEMEQAWQTIRKHPSVGCSIDLFFIGIILFRQEFKEKQHHTIRF